MKQYVKASLEIHLFFGRIMKEHALFLQASFPSKDTGFRNEADRYREEFEKALETAVKLSDGKVGESVLTSGEVFTEYTERAERQTAKLTGIPICTQITQAEEKLQAGCPESLSRETVQQVRLLNQRVMRLLNGLISFKEKILQEVTSCRLYTANYPLLIEHILREARWYRQMLNDIERGRFEKSCSRNVEVFWNQIMMEHAEFIRGLLDPTEGELINAADGFVGDFYELLEKAKKQDCKVSEDLARKTMETTKKYRDFKEAGANGILNCQVRSVILPLLADHVLREANHYLRLQGEMD